MSSEWLDSVARHRPHRPTRSGVETMARKSARKKPIWERSNPDASTRPYRVSRRRRRNGWRKKQDGPTPTWSITRVLREASSPRDAYSWACAGVAGGSGIAGAGSGGFALRAFTTFARDTLLREEWGVFFAFRADWRDG